MASGSQPFTIVGAGRIGQALKEMGSGQDVLIRRGEKIPEGGSGPIIICTRNDDLQGVLDSTPKSRWDDLVFLQNGMLDPWLQSKGLENNTQALIYFAVAKLGEKPTDGKTDTNPEGLTAATGKHASVLAERLIKGGLSCKVLDASDYRKSMLEKLVWISAFMVVGATHKCTVGEVEGKHKAQVAELIAELAEAGGADLGVKLDGGYVERLCAYARSVAHFPTAVKEFEWRNGYFYNISVKAMQQGKADPCPKHTAMLKSLNIY